MALKILVCEDEKISHGWLVKMIKSWGHSTVSAYTGAEAISRANQEQPDVILLDMLYPDMEGVEVLKKLRENSDLDATRVITVSATSTEELAPQIKDFNVWTSLSKPIKKAELKHLIDEFEDSSDLPELEQPTFMVITKNGVHQKVLEKLLTSLGCQTLAADTMETAEQLLSSVKIAGIIVELDVEPSKIGEALRKIKAVISDSTPIILEILTVDQNTLWELSALRVTDILVKPVNMNRLKASVEDIIEKLKAAHEAKSGSGSKTILIVEDFSITANMLARIFSKTTFQTIVARSGPQAYELIVKKKPDLMLLDLNLPGMNGVELLELLKANSLKIPFAVSTAERDQTKLRILNKMGALKIFRKPIVGEELLSFIRSFNFQTGVLDHCQCDYSILFASEDDSTIQAVEQALHSADLSYHLAADSTQVHAEIKGRPPVLVIDMGFKSLDGKDLIKRIRSSKQNETMKILGLAEQLDESLKQEMTELGVDSVVAKPFSIAELAEQLQEMLSAVPPSVDLSEFSSQFLNELDKLPLPQDAVYLEQAKRLGHNLAGTAGLISSAELHDAGIKLEETADQGDSQSCQKQVNDIRKQIEQLAAKATLLNQ